MGRERKKVEQEEKEEKEPVEKNTSPQTLSPEPRALITRPWHPAYPYRILDDMIQFDLA